MNRKRDRVILLAFVLVIYAACTQTSSDTEHASEALAMSDAGADDTVSATQISGTASYRERMALPPDASFEATIEDVSRADAPATVLGSARTEPAGQPPFRFTINYEPAKLEGGRRYAVRARITHNGRLLFTSDRHYALPSPGQELSILLVRAQSAPSSTATAALENTYWKLIRIGEEVVNVGAEQGEAHLVLHSQDKRVAGFGGCKSSTSWFFMHPQLS